MFNPEVKKISKKLLRKIFKRILNVSAKKPKLGPRLNQRSPEVILLLLVLLIRLHS